MRKMISWSKEALAKMSPETLNAWLAADQGAVYEMFDGADPLTLSLAILWAVGKIDESRG